MTAEIITVGNELLLGRTVDTNAAWLAQRLDEAGFRVVRRVSVGDDLDAIQAAVRDALETSVVVVMTGGLGPTHDDVTKKAVAAVFEVDLDIDPELESSLAAMYERRGRRFTPGRRTMATVPHGFEWLRNPIGSAPGLVKKSTKPDPKCLFVLPGVPYEMKAIYGEHSDYAFDHLIRSGLRHETFRTAGLTESRVQEMLAAVFEKLPTDVSLAFLPDPRNGVSVRISARGDTDREAENAIKKASEQVCSVIGKHVYGRERDRLEDVVGKLLEERGMTLSVAESCTGGLIGDRVTDIAGASAYFEGGVLTYSDAAKIEFLGVEAEVLASAGAVSREVAEQMASGCRNRFGSDVALSVTGIAGPTGGTPEKPVGTVWVGIADARGVSAFHMRLTENRRLNKELAATAALNVLRRKLWGKGRRERGKRKRVNGKG